MAKEVSFQNLLVLALILIIISVSLTVLVLNQTKPFSITGLVSGIARVNVSDMLIISLPVNEVDFGTISRGSSDDTTDNNPQPFLIQNDGNVKVDVTIARDANSTPLFNGTGGGDNSSSFQFKADRSSEHDSFNYGQSQNSWANVPGTASVLVVKGLKFADNHDTAEVDLKIAVPFDEPPGLKSEGLNFIAAQS